MAGAADTGAEGTGFDHLTLVVRDLAGATEFFGLLGFHLDRQVVVSGPVMASYMGIEGWEADHVTLVLGDAPSRQEVQLLRFHSPEPVDPPDRARLDRLGFNHVCFKVRDLDAVLADLRRHGVVARSDVMTFHDRRLVLLAGPEGVTVELAQWIADPPPGEG